MYRAVIDPAPDHVAFALFDDEKQLILENRPMRGRDAAELPVFILDTLRSCGVDFHAVKRWTVGAGPGSFTGLRLVSAMVSAWCLDKEDVRSRNIPGAIALAGMLHLAADEKAGAVYDGRNKEILYFGVTGTASGDVIPTGETAVLNKEQAEEFFRNRPQERLAMFSCEAEAIRKILPQGVEASDFAFSDTALLNRTQSRDFDNDLTRLVYIRPAVYAAN